MTCETHIIIMLKGKGLKFYSVKLCLVDRVPVVVVTDGVGSADAQVDR